MVGTSETTATKAGSPHTEIAPVFLHKDIGGDLRGAKQAVHCLVDAHRFVNPMPPIGVIVQKLPAGGLLDERQPVGCVTVDLVGAGKNEASVRTVLPRRL